MPTAKIKKKQILNFDHQIDDAASHSAAPVNKRGKLVKTNSVTGAIELIDGVRQHYYAGLAGFIQNVEPGFQIEFYLENEGVLKLINISYEYIEEHKHIAWISNYQIPLGIAIIKQI
jgi:hypothetical protein